MLEMGLKTRDTRCYSWDMIIYKLRNFTILEVELKTRYACSQLHGHKMNDI